MPPRNVEGMARGSSLLGNNYLGVALRALRIVCSLASLNTSLNLG